MDKYYESVNQEPNKNLLEIAHYISIDSRHRNRNNWPNPAEYQVHFSPADSHIGASIPARFKNIKCIELVSGRLPNVNSILNEQYLNLVIEELDSVYDATATSTSKAFAKLYFDKIIGNFVTIDNDEVNKSYQRYQPGRILDGVSKWSIRLEKEDGTLFNFGSDTSPPTAPTNTLQNSFTFKIVTLEQDTSYIGRRNI